MRAQAMIWGSRRLGRRLPSANRGCRKPLVCFGPSLQHYFSSSSLSTVDHFVPRHSNLTTSGVLNGCRVPRSILQTSSAHFPCHLTWMQKRIDNFSSTRDRTTGPSLQLKTDSDVVKFSVGKLSREDGSGMGNKKPKKVKMSKRAKVNELRFYRLKAKKKMNSSNPEVRIRYKLEKAKRKEAWLIEKLMKFDLPRGPPETYDPEILTEEEKHYLKRTGEKKKNFVIVGRRGVFGGVVLNMHLHWKKHETVKVICKPCRPGQIHDFADELSRLSKGIVIDIKPNNSIVFYRGKNYVQPEVMSPPETLSKAKALEKYRLQQSLEHTSHFIEKLEKELEEYLEHASRYKKLKDEAQCCSMPNTDGDQNCRGL
ncbi:unnamed protein product [Linum trigynum]|uniref:CRM domain-containing protein n=1 Tax=Linum trigynum TaxID=586398 RepID=A0AAV2GK54_9ROSI